MTGGPALLTPAHQPPGASCPYLRAFSPAAFCPQGLLEPVPPRHTGHLSPGALDQLPGPLAVYHDTLDLHP